MSIGVDIRGYPISKGDYCITTINRLLRISRIAGASGHWQNRHLHMSFLDGPDTVSFGPRSAPFAALSLEPFLKGFTFNEPLGAPTEFKDIFGNTIHMGQTVVHATYISTAHGKPAIGWKSWYYLAMSRITNLSKDFLWAQQISAHPQATPEEHSLPAPARRQIKKCIVLGPNLKHLPLQARLKSI